MPTQTRLGTAFCTAGALVLMAGTTQATTYKVGPTREVKTLQEIERSLKPGDLVEVDGDATYPGGVWFRNDGTSDKRIRIIGIPINGRMPRIQGGDEWSVLMNGDHYVLDGFEVTQGPEYCIIHKAHDVTLRNTVVHDCPKHGVLGTDSESGSLTMEHCEVFGCGEGTRKHQLYIATDETAHPGSVFRLQWSYIHDGKGGNNVKSRAERNEIYFNWIEGAVYHGLDLIGPDGQDEDLAREDSDVVGNVIITTSEWQVARIGGDGTGNTSGRYRFAGNTFLLGSSSDLAIRMQETVQSVELYNNVFLHEGQSPALLGHSDESGPSPHVRGSHNWIQTGWEELPKELVSTLRGANAGLTDLAGHDFRPAKGSPLIDQGSSTMTANDEQSCPGPLTSITSIPPYRVFTPSDAKLTRPSSGAIDIGAYEEASPKEVPQPYPVERDYDDVPPSTTGTGGTGGRASSATGGSTSDAGCACEAGHRTQTGLLATLGALGLAAVGLATRRRALRKRDPQRVRDSSEL